MSVASIGLGQQLASLCREAPPDAPAIQVLDSPVGPLVAAASGDGLLLLEFGAEQRLSRQLGILRRLFGPVRAGRHAVIDATAAELAEYFAGRRQRFTVPLVIRGTPFQEQVWRLLLEIPYGETRAYADLAEAIGIRNGQRAVGLANGQNRIAIIVPCHRVIERAGGLRGYGGGLDKKRFLLDLERRHVDPLIGTPLGRGRAL